MIHIPEHQTLRVVQPAKVRIPVPDCEGKVEPMFPVSATLYWPEEGDILYEYRHPSVYAGYDRNFGKLIRYYHYDPDNYPIVKKMKTFMYYRGDYNFLKANMEQPSLREVKSPLHMLSWKQCQSILKKSEISMHEQSRVMESIASLRDEYRPRLFGISIDAIECAQDEASMEKYNTLTVLSMFTYMHNTYIWQRSRFSIGEIRGAGMGHLSRYMFATDPGRDSMGEDLMHRASHGKGDMLVHRIGDYKSTEPLDDGLVGYVESSDGNCPPPDKYVILWKDMEGPGMIHDQLIVCKTERLLEVMLGPKRLNVIL